MTGLTFGVTDSGFVSRRRHCIWGKNCLESNVRHWECVTEGPLQRASVVVAIIKFCPHLMANGQSSARSVSAFAPWSAMLGVDAPTGFFAVHVRTTRWANVPKRNDLAIFHMEALSAIRSTQHKLYYERCRYNKGKCMCTPSRCSCVVAGVPSSKLGSPVCCGSWCRDGVRSLAAQLLAARLATMSTISVRTCSRICSFLWRCNFARRGRNRFCAR